MSRLPLPLPEKVRITATTCAYCRWVRRERPLHAWMALVEHHRLQHRGEPSPARPDELEVLRGDWEAAAVAARTSKDPLGLIREAQASTKLWAYLEEHGLTNTPANPLYRWVTALEAYRLRIEWETAVVKLAADERTAQAEQSALTTLLHFLDDHAPYGAEYDPRRRNK